MNKIKMMNKTLMKRMNVKLWVLGTCLWAWTLSVQAQQAYRYRVKLQDKAATAFTLEAPQAYLSERALERRSRQGLAVDSTDLPICAAYVDRLCQEGAQVVLRSKWNNTVVLQVTDTLVMKRVAALPFVSSVQWVWTAPDSIPPRNAQRKEEATNKMKKMDQYYGDAYCQVALHQGDSLHAAGFRGQGVHIAVIDAGFYNVDVIKIFRKLNLLGTRDFVNPQSDIYAEHFHGMKVLSCLAANQPKVMVGTAPEASYWLLRSEDDDTEQPIEEDYWAAAMEFADSVGVDVVNTSLGYYEFDNPAYNYSYRDLDGHRSLMSHTASLAAGKGIVVVCSAGNEGGKSWKKITPPGDAEGVLTVGSIQRSLLNSDFSSIGNTADGRLKPDVMAVGEMSLVAGNNGGTSYANGTSFASPTLCGLVACFWQACPWLTAREVVKAVQQAGDRTACPDNIFGYGVPNLWKAYRQAQATRPCADEGQPLGTESSK